MDDFFKRFFGEQFGGIPRARPETPRRERRTVGQGSGFVFAAKDGLFTDKTFILTNNHVVEGAKEVTVTLVDKKEHKAEVVGRDPKTDLAVLKIELKETLPSAAMGDSEQLKVGDWVIAIGNPFGFSHTVTTGVISALGFMGIGLAFLGGFLMAFGAALGRGCTSGQALSGGATLTLGSWMFMFVMFGAAYGAAYFFRKQWI